MTFLGRDAPNLLAHLARMGRDGGLQAIVDFILAVQSPQA
jgi:hypothetical protein